MGRSLGTIDGSAIERLIGYWLLVIRHWGFGVENGESNYYLSSDICPLISSLPYPLTICFPCFLPPELLQLLNF